MTCGKCKGATKLVIGALLLLNAFVWPQWTDLTGWIAWVGVLMAVGGFLMLVVPNKCSRCNAMCSMPKEPAKRSSSRKKTTRRRR